MLVLMLGGYIQMASADPDIVEVHTAAVKLAMKARAEFANQLPGWPASSLTGWQLRITTSARAWRRGDGKLACRRL
jgi:hypothetical protein